MRWIPFPDTWCAVHGLAWFAENTPHLWRLPERMKGAVRPPVWELARHPSGGRLRFRTDATTLAVRAFYPESATYHNMSLIGQMGMDLYVDGRYWRSIAPKTVSTPQAGEFEEVLFEDAPPRWREICVYLPNYAPVELRAIGVNDGASFAAPEPFPFAPIAFYGSSITQGGCASRPGMSYQAILGRMVGVDFVNLGFSGNGMGEPELAEAMAEIPASLYVLDFAQNLKEPEKVREVYAPFMDILRRARPDVPMLCITPIYAALETSWADMHVRLEGMREVIREAVAARVRDGDRMVRLVEGYTLLGPDVPDGFVDGVHPNDVGFRAIAEGLVPVITDALGLI